MRALLTQLQQSFQLAIKCDTVFFSTFQTFGMNFGHIPSLPGEMLNIYFFLNFTKESFKVPFTRDALHAVVTCFLPLISNI